jgi:hypothetical protein
MIIEIEGSTIDKEITWAERFSISPDKDPRLDACQKSRPLYRFRAELANYLTNHVCSDPIKCRSFGSDTASSDIDVTIDGGLQLVENALYTYIRIRKFLELVFAHDTLLTERPVDVFHFFDLNFYLSNFAIKKRPGASDNLLSSYILSTAYGPYIIKDSTQIRNQSQYAVSEIFDTQTGTSMNQDVRDAMYVNNVEKVVALINRLRDSGAVQNVYNMIVDMLSQISLYEDECYHTQGAFFHVVLMMQRKINFIDVHRNSVMFNLYIEMLYTSALENLSFAMTHKKYPAKVAKYVHRVNDALHRISEAAGKKALIDPLEDTNQITIRNAMIALNGIMFGNQRPLHNFPRKVR